jgi:hypothetical protein
MISKGGALMHRRKEGKTGTPGDGGREVVNQESSRTLTDEEMVTERRSARRSFLTAAGTFLAGGALAIVAGRRAAAQDPDSDAKSQKKDEDADKKKETGAKSKKTKKAKTEKDTDADKAKGKEEKPAPPQ